MSAYINFVYKFKNYEIHTRYVDNQNKENGEIEVDKNIPIELVRYSNEESNITDILAWFVLDWSGYSLKFFDDKSPSITVPQEDIGVIWAMLNKAYEVVRLYFDIENN